MAKKLETLVISQETRDRIDRILNDPEEFKRRCEAADKTFKESPAYQQFLKLEEDVRRSEMLTAADYAITINYRG